VETVAEAMGKTWYVLSNTLGPRKLDFFYLVSKQHGPLVVKLVYNTMESFQQKVPPISFGAFEDIFD
jgi:hypothetical protein